MLNDVVSKDVVLSFVETDYTVGEGAGAQPVCVEVDSQLNTSIFVTVDGMTFHTAYDIVSLSRHPLANNYILSLVIKSSGALQVLWF